MATINGNIYDSFAPVSFTQSAKDLSRTDRSNYLTSANVPKRYQVRWAGTGYNGVTINETYVPTKLNGTTSTGTNIELSSAGFITFNNGGDVRNGDSDGSYDRFAIPIFNY